MINHCNQQFLNDFQKGELDYKSELQQLEREGEMSLDELLASLPSELLEERAKTDINEEERTNPSEEDGEDKMEDQNNKEKSSTRAARYEETQERVGVALIQGCGCMGNYIFIEFIMISMT